MNQSASIYQDMATRTGSSIYIGVVGPVRTGKSTFIKRFMETQVLPNIDDSYRRDRARDELPQSGSGRTIMTAEPKFVPEEAVEVCMEEGVTFSVRLIDCVGYMVPGAVGQYEDLSPRMVMTPWYDHEIPMTEAAELGTRKVICDHSTVGIVVTTDGSVTEIPREDYLEAEERVIRELQELGKPFVVLLNSAQPQGSRAQSMAADIERRYDVRCLPVNCLELGEQEITELLQGLLYEFPLRELDLFLPAGGGSAAGPPHQNRRIPSGAPGGGGPGPCAAAAGLPVRPAGGGGYLRRLHPQPEPGDRHCRGGPGPAPEPVLRHPEPPVGPVRDGRRRPDAASDQPGRHPEGV